MSAWFHYIKRGRAFGPVAEADFIDLLSRKVISDEDLVRIDGATSWTPAAKLAADIKAGTVRESRSAPPKTSSSFRGLANQTVFTSAPPSPGTLERRQRLRPASRRLCGHCAGSADPDARFCPHCGKQLAF